MNKLSQLRGQLESLARRRRGVRWGSAICAAGLVLLWFMAAAFLIDWTLQLDRALRLLGWFFLVAGVVWGVRRFVRPWFQEDESELDLALALERRQGIDSDLVAAMQFEHAHDRGWGSADLQQAVVNRVASMAPKINVMEDFSAVPLFRRGLLLLLTVSAFGLFTWQFPGHVSAFANRLMLGSAHYPTKTQIQYVLVNQRRTDTVPAGSQGSASQQFTAPYGKSLEFHVVADGNFPAQGEVHLRGRSTGATTSLDLEPVAEDIHLAMLSAANAAIDEIDQTIESLATTEDPAQEPAIDIDTASRWRDRWENQANELAAYAPLLAQHFRDGTQQLEITDEIAVPLPLKVWKDWINTARTASANAEKQRVFRGRLPQFVDSLQYQVYLGDAWTDSKWIEVIPLPVVDLQLEVTPPDYAGGAAMATVPPAGARQISVLESSRVSLEIRSTKPLAEAVVTMDGESFSLKHDPSAKPASEAGDAAGESTSQTSAAQVWRLPTGSPLDRVQAPLQYSVQVTDSDGLSLERPLQGYIRIQSDRAPKVYLDVTTRHVVPDANPSLWFGASDDFGLAGLRLHWQVIRAPSTLAAAASAGTELPEQMSIEIPLHGRPTRLAPLVANFDLSLSQQLDQNTIPPEVREVLQTGEELALSPTATVTVQQPGTRWALADGDTTFMIRREAGRLNLYRQFILDLTSLQLQKEDQVRLELEATDFRGDEPGVATRSEPLMLTVTDERGVLAAMVESDEQSAQQLNSIIQRQLGIVSGQ